MNPKYVRHLLPPLASLLLILYFFFFVFFFVFFSTSQPPIPHTHTHTHTRTYKKGWIRNFGINITHEELGKDFYEFRRVAGPAAFIVGPDYGIQGCITKGCV